MNVSLLNILSELLTACLHASFKEYMKIRRKLDSVCQKLTEKFKRFNLTMVFSALHIATKTSHLYAFKKRLTIFCYCLD